MPLVKHKYFLVCRVEDQVSISEKYTITFYNSEDNDFGSLTS